MLYRLRIDELKLDRGFLRRLSGEEENRRHIILEQIISMARKFGVSTVAEGIETQQDLAQYLDAAKNSISEIENGKRTTTAEKIALICEHYRISADYLLGLSDDPTPR